VADPIRGKLVWQGTGTTRVRRIVYPTKKGMSQPTPFDADQLAPALRGNTADEVEVDLELQAGKPVRIRPVGQPFVAAAARPQQPPPLERRAVQGGRPQEGGRRPGPREQGRGQEHRAQAPPAFHNPYNFVPAPRRNTAHVDLGDHAPFGHHRYYGGRVSGSIRVRMVLKTPLLLPDAARSHDHQEDNPALGIKPGHKDFPVRVDADGKPHLPPTSIKGMLRAAYEAVTNSRLAVFAGHQDRLADRMPARDGLALVPARIVTANGMEMIELLPGDSGISGTGRPAERDPMYAAWLPRYDRQTGQVAPFAVRYPDNSLPQHRDAVEVWLELWERTGQHPFAYWSVRKCVRAGQPLGQQPQPGQRRGAHQPRRGVAMISANGHVCVTNRNIDRKHDERVFFTTRDKPVLHPLSEGLRQQWAELIRNYQAIHQAEREAGMNSPPALNNSTWSRQVVGGADEQALSEGALCFAAFNQGDVVALYPVMISRRLFQDAPLSLLPVELQPATTLSQLSPADRVFGWVSQEGQGAYRGNVRVGPVNCESPDPVERFPGVGVPLAILGQPKEQQARFYVARSPDGEAQEDGLSKDDAGYVEGKGLRGRKVYPHHAGLPAGHWDEPMTDRTQQANGGHFQEYRRPRLNGQEQRDNQNRSVQGWVKEGTAFIFDLHVTNLSNVELGALLWLLSLPPEHFHRLGGGKPLGFGSVRLEIDSAHTTLHDGEGWREFYGTLGLASPAAVDQQAAVQAFKDAVRSAYGHGAAFEQVSFIAAFLKMASGFSDQLPTHYPRARQQGQSGSVPPHPEGQAYEWFVANDRTGAQGGPRVSLRDLATDPGLPMLDAP
jgi:CRISPR-associated protein (TIGR03986 family)